MTKQLCKLLSEYIQEEKKGARDYRKLAKRLPQKFRGMPLKAARDEYKHSKSLNKIKNKICKR